MRAWLSYLRQGLSRKLPEDRNFGRPIYGSSKANLKKTLPYLKRHWRRGLVGCLFVAGAAMLALPPPLITRYLVDDVILGRQIGLLAGAVCMLVLCLAGEKLARLLEAFHFARFEQQVTLDIQEDLIERVLHLPKSFFDDKQTGYLQSRLTEDIDGIRWFFSSTMVHVISNGLRLLGGISFLFYLEWKLAFVVLLLLPGLGWIIRFFSGRIYRLSHQAMEGQADVAGRTEESLAEVTLIKANAKEDATRNHLMSTIRNVFQINLEQSVVNSLAAISINAIPALARIVTLAAGAFWIINGQWTIGSLLAFQAYLAYVFGPAQILASTNLQFQKARAALERVSAIFDLAPEDNCKEGCKVDKLEGEIEFRNVSFGYNGFEPILQNISLHLRPGERVALAGPSGIGKTTLISLILRFYRPTAGEIYFDGQPASAYNTRSLRRRIGFASQTPRIITGSAWENLRYGEPDADERLIRRAARVAAIHDDIEKLPHKYDTIIGAKGINLSEGQKQRLSIARALIKEPDILILDEPTSALDGDTEKSIFEALPSRVKGKTVLVASHRPSTIMQADRILLINEAGITDLGTPDSLLRSNCLYNSVVPNPSAGITLQNLELAG
jgi:ABC-type multidrug transport system fused ATPase/permease subunit